MIGSRSKTSPSWACVFCKALNQWQFIPVNGGMDARQRYALFGKRLKNHSPEGF
jgi:hypothetical protein